MVVAKILGGAVGSITSSAERGGAVPEGTGTVALIAAGGLVIGGLISGLGQLGWLAGSLLTLGIATTAGLVAAHATDYKPLKDALSTSGNTSPTPSTTTQPTAARTRSTGEENLGTMPPPDECPICREAAKKKGKSK